MKVQLSNIVIPKQLERFDLGNIRELADNIRRYGLLHPIVVNEQMKLIAGFRRLKAAELLGWHAISVTVVNQQTEIKNRLAQFDAHLSENMKRKDMHPLEISEAILERKLRFEETYGKIEHGGDHCSDDYNKSKFAQCELAFPDFYEETARLLHLSPQSVYKFLKLNELDVDLKEQVRNNTMSYRTALEQQAGRNRVKRQTVKSKHPVSTFRLPNQETAEMLTATFNRSPNLFQLFMLLNHSWQTIQQIKDKFNDTEYEPLTLEILHQFITQLGEVMGFYQTLLTQLSQVQEKKLIAETETFLTTSMNV